MNNLPKPKRLFADIETCPNIALLWKSGFKLTVGPENIIKERSIICIAYKWEGESNVQVLTWNAQQSDKAMLRAFSKIAAKADEVIAHNGDRYDWPWLRTRCLIHGLPTFPDVKTVDTMKIAKHKFALNSIKLDYIAKLLHVGAKTSTGFGLWKAVLLDRDPAALEKMGDYCANDVRVLEAVYHKLTPYAKPATHTGVLFGSAVWTCPRCGSQNIIKSKTCVTASGALRHQMKCKDDGEYFTLSDAAFKKYQKATGR